MSGSINYCQNLWVQFAKVTSAQDRSRIALGKVFESSDNILIEELKHSVAMFEAEIQLMRGEWEKSFFVMSTGRKIFSAEYQILKIMSQETGIDMPEIERWKIQISNEGLVASVSLDYAKCSDISFLGNLVNLEFLNLSNNPIEDITPLENLANLKSLFLADTQITDISPLEKLNNLKVLDIQKTPTTDISALGSMIGLEDISLIETPVADLTPLQSLANLRTINLDRTKITDLSPLESLPNISDLTLSHTQISDLGPLRSLTNLEELSIYNTPVTDIAVLLDLPKLKEIWIGETPASRDSIQQETARKLQQRGVDVSYD